MSLGIALGIALLALGAAIGALTVAAAARGTIADLTTQRDRWRSLAQPPSDPGPRTIGDDPEYWQHPMPPTGEAAAPNARHARSDGPMPIEAGEPTPARTTRTEDSTQPPEEPCSRTT